MVVIVSYSSVLQDLKGKVAFSESEASRGDSSPAFMKALIKSQLNHEEFELLL